MSGKYSLEKINADIEARKAKIDSEKKERVTKINADIKKKRNSISWQMGQAVFGVAKNMPEVAKTIGAYAEKVKSVHKELENAGAKTYSDAYSMLTKAGYDDTTSGYIANKYMPTPVSLRHASFERTIDRIMNPQDDPYNAMYDKVEESYAGGNDRAYEFLNNQVKGGNMHYWEAEGLARKYDIHNPNDTSEKPSFATFDEYRPVYDITNIGALSQEEQENIISQLRNQHPDDYLWQTVFGESGFADVGKTDYHTWEIYNNLPETVGDYTGHHALSKEKIKQWEDKGYSRDDIAESLRLYAEDPAERNNVYNDIYVNKHLTFEEKLAFARIWDEEGRAAAEKYVDSFRETAAYLEGAQKREEIGDNTLKELLFDIRYGAAEALRGFERSGSNTAEKATSPEAYTSNIIYEEAANGGPKIGGKSLEQWAHRGATTVGGMLPSITIGVATGSIGGAAAGTIARAVTIFGSAQGNGVQQALNAGASYEEAQVYGFSTGIAEATLDTVLGSVGKVGGGAFSKLSGNAAAKAAKSISKASPKLAKVLKWGGAYSGKVVGEVIEEYSQYLLDPALQNLIYDAGNEIEPFSEEAFETVMLAAMISSAFDIFGVGTYLDVIRKPTKAANVLLEQTEGIKALEEARNAFKEKVDSGTVTLDDIADFAGKSAGYGHNYNPLKSPSSLDNKEAESYNSDELTFDEEGSVLAYKSGESYKINGAINSSVELDDTQSYIADNLDSALTKMPVYTGTVYRNVVFDDFGGQEAFSAFMRKHQIGNEITYHAFTSASAFQDGYPVQGEYVVHIEIESKNGKTLAGHGNNFESEVLFGRNSEFLVKDIRYTDNTPTIILEEISNEENGIHTGRDEGHSGRDYQIQSRYDPSGIYEKRNRGGAQKEGYTDQRREIASQGGAQKSQEAGRYTPADVDAMIDAAFNKGDGDNAIKAIATGIMYSAMRGETLTSADIAQIAGDERLTGVFNTAFGTDIDFSSLHSAYSKANSAIRKGELAVKDEDSVGFVEKGQAISLLSTARESQRVLTTSDDIGIIDTRFNSMADPMYEVFGSGENSHPEEIKAFRKEIATLGVEITEPDNESLGYCPGLHIGEPGKLYISKGASYSAWCHEIQHMRDDYAEGWTGMRILADVEKRYEREKRAYEIEIDMANKANRSDIAKRLIENLEKERRAIYGL